MTYYKAIRPDGRSFNDPSFAWATGPGRITVHPMYGKRNRDESTAAGYLSVSVSATDCTGMRWPCRLLEVEPVGRVWTPEARSLPSKRAGLRWRTVRELDAHEALGPQGVHVAALIDRAYKVTPDEADRLYAAWDAARYAAWDAARDAAWDAARDAAWYAAGAAAGDAAGALVVRDLIGQHFTLQHYDTLTRTWAEVIGPAHPDDALRGES